MNKETLVRHHLLELIFFKNADGTVTHINNSMSKLVELGIYYDYKLTITITNSEHWKLHHKYGTFGFDDDFRSKVSKATKDAMKNVDYDKLAYWKGKKQTDAQKAKKLAKLRERTNAYREYKANGGILKFNEFQTEYAKLHKQQL